MTIELTLPDGKKNKYDSEITGYDIALSISEGLANSAIAVEVNNKLLDLKRPITESGTFKIITKKDAKGLEIMRHSTAHILAEAVISLFPYAKPTIGPVVEEGFYYDFGHEPFTQEDLKKIEDKMKEIIKENKGFERIEVTKKEALEMFNDNQYKQEMIKDIADDGQVITVYKQGKFADLCRGPHIPNAGKIKAVKLMKLAGAYWRADAKNDQLQRIYGISFFDKKELNAHLYLLEEAEKRDHKKLGKQFDLFSLHEEGQGFPFFHPKGMVIFNELLTYWRETHTDAEYTEIKTPMMLNKKLWEISGHWENYKENMYVLNIDEQEFAIKPMNCPGGMIYYKNTLHSYRELPMRVGEIGLVHRHELSGALSGLFRVRCFHQDDAHIFMTQDQIKDEIIGVIKLVDKMYSTFGLTFSLELSTKPEKAIGNDDLWDKATEGLKGALETAGYDFKINEGDGAFYGPKIDIHIKDALGRSWQCGTIQLDMALPERFNLTYEGEDGKKHQPVMIHRVIYGSIERFFGILIEHFAGKFPLWLSPVQVRVLPIADRHLDYAKEVRQQLKDAGLRAEVDSKTESIPKKVREAQLDYINYILVVGDKEAENKTVNVRTRDNVVHGEKKVDDLILELLDEAETRKL